MDSSSFRGKNQNLSRSFHAYQIDAHERDFRVDFKIFGASWKIYVRLYLMSPFKKEKKERKNKFLLYHKIYQINKHIIHNTSVN